MSLALAQAAPPRIQVDRGDGFVTFTVWPAGLRRAFGTLLIQVCLYAFLMFLVLFTDDRILKWSLGFNLVMFVLFQLHATRYQASAGKASITVGASDIIIRFSDWFGSGSVHWLRDEITDISARVRDTLRYDVGMRSMLVSQVSRMYVLSVQTVPSFRIRVLNGLFLNYEEATWLADALHRELELPKYDVGR